MKTLSPTVLIVGGGPAGLTAAAELGKSLGGEVLVVDREKDAGGIPRHADHPGYGMRDLKKFVSGPKYARLLVKKAEAAGVTIMTQTQVTGYAEDGALEATSPEGRLLIKPKATILATGARERPRMARRIPGDRPGGVLTTGQLQNMIHLHGEKLSGKAVIIGGELVSWSAALTLKEAGAQPVALVTEYPKSESYRIFRGPGSIFFRSRVVTRSKVVRVIGRGRVSAIEIEHLDTGRRATLDCDWLVFTGDWVPDHELARMAHLDMDPATKSPRVDSGLRTSKEGVFAIGNILHPVETADAAALDGKHVAAQVLDYLGGASIPSGGIDLTVEKPLRWVSPNVLRPGDVGPARDRLLFWVDEYVARPTIEARQGGKLVGSMKTAWPAAPGRVFRVPASILEKVDRGGEPVTISIV